MLALVGRMPQGGKPRLLSSLAGAPARQCTPKGRDMTPWSWWAGEPDADVYNLACEEKTRAAAIAAASSQLRPGDRFQVVEARSSEARRYEGSECVPFLRTRNHEIVTVGPAPVKPIS